MRSTLCTNFRIVHNGTLPSTECKIARWRQQPCNIIVNCQNYHYRIDLAKRWKRMVSEYLVKAAGDKGSCTRSLGITHGWVQCYSQTGQSVSCSIPRHPLCVIKLLFNTHQAPEQKTHLSVKINQRDASKQDGVQRAKSCQRHIPQKLPQPVYKDDTSCFT
jgi:hypothetical protein